MQFLFYRSLDDSLGQRFFVAILSSCVAAAMLAPAICCGSSKISDSASSSSTPIPSELSVNQDETPNDETEDPLPMDPEIAVITYQREGGFRARRPDDEKPEPLLQIFADGRVVAGKTRAGLKRTETEIPRKELKALVKFCLRDQDVAEMTSESLKEKMEATGKRNLLADGLTSVFQFQTENLEKSLRIYALDYSSRTFAEVGELKKLQKVEARLKGYVAVAATGGRKAFDELLEKINTELKKQHPGAPPFSLDNVRYAQAVENGMLMMALGNLAKGKDGKATNYSASVKKPGDGQPEIRITASGPSPF